MKLTLKMRKLVEKKNKDENYIKTEIIVKIPIL